MCVYIYTLPSDQVAFSLLSLNTSSFSSNSFKIPLLLFISLIYLECILMFIHLKFVFWCYMKIKLFYHVILPKSHSLIPLITGKKSHFKRGLWARLLGFESCIYYILTAIWETLVKQKIAWHTMQNSLKNALTELSKCI